MKTLGFTANCADDADECEKWAGMGECDNNPGFMRSNCRRSCKLCSEPPSSQAKPDKAGDAACFDVSSKHNCEYWSTFGDCEDNVVFMRDNCARSCGVCETHDGDGRKDEL